MAIDDTLIFRGRTDNEYEGTDGYYESEGQSYTECEDDNCTTFWEPPKYIEGEKSGIENKTFVYELDCRDKTFNRIGDRTGKGLKKGWMETIEDPVADAVDMVTNWLAGLGWACWAGWAGWLAAAGLPGLRWGCLV